MARLRHALLASVTRRFRVMPNRPKVVLNEKALEMFAGAACVDKHSSCPQRAARGECTSSPGWMVMMCSKSCDSCHLRDPQLRCARGALNMAQTPALVPGTLDAQFVAVASSGAYNVTVHSGPRAAFPYVAANASRDGPWVLTFENFVSDAEAEAIIKSVESKFSRSTDQGQVDQYGEQKKIVSSGRTSENAWCTGECENSQSVKTVMRRIEAITAVPTENYESFQVLRYMPGQYYRPHHDMSSADNKLACGPRIYTFFLYLSDVEEGGETEFPSLRDAAGTPLRIRFVTILILHCTELQRTGPSAVLPFGGHPSSRTIRRDRTRGRRMPRFPSLKGSSSPPTPGCIFSTIPLRISGVARVHSTNSICPYRLLSVTNALLILQCATFPAASSACPQ